MLFQRFFNQPKANKFAYTPVFYNEKKEALERKIRAAKEDKDVIKNLSEDEFRNRIREKMGETRREKVSLANFKAKHKSKSSFTLIFAILLIAAVLFFQYNL